MRPFTHPPVTGLRSYALAALALTFGCASSESHSEFADADALAQHSPPDAEIGIAEYIQIDDNDLLGAGAHDANLCGPASHLVAQAAGVCSGPYDGTDNANYPGPDPSAPATLGANSDYIDWADLLAVAPGVGSPHFLLDLDTQAGDDDIFKVGSCIDTGHSPSKANLTFTGVAANEDYLYLMSERETTNGSEKHHYIFSQLVPTHSVHPDCSEPTWLWDMQEGDILVELTFASTASLAEAVVDIWRWSAPNEDDVLAEQLLQASNWVAIPAAETPPAYTAYNVAYNKNKTPTEDDEAGIQGVDLASGQLAEIAIDIEQVFGVGCGLRRTMSVISTASASPGGNDDLKDFQSPVTLVTGSLDLDLTLNETCLPGFDWDASAMLAGQDVLDDPDIDFSIEWDCGAGGSGSFAVTEATGFQPTGPGDCTATLIAIGAANSDRDGCDADTDGNGISAYAALSASLTVEGSCDESFTYEPESVSGGNGEYTYHWSFDGPTDEPDHSTNDSSQGGGSLNAPGPGDVTAHLYVTDSRGIQDCASPPAEQSVPVYTPLEGSLQLDQFCDGSFSFEVVGLSGGAGGYTYAWTFSGDTDKAPTADASGAGSANNWPAPGAVHADLTVTSAEGDCTLDIDGDTPVYWPFSAIMGPVGEPAQCTDDDVSFLAELQGGSGQYSIDWTLTGATLVGCPAEGALADIGGDGLEVISCAFDYTLGAVCPSGQIELSATDEVCGSSDAGGVAAARECTTTVTDLP